MAAPAAAGFAQLSDRREGRGLAAALSSFAATLVAAAGCALALTATASSAVHDSAQADRAAAPYRATVGCYDRADWAALVRSAYPHEKGHETDVYGLWRYEQREVALPSRACLSFERWRTAKPGMLGIWIFVLGHELTHAQQTDLEGAPWQRPFDEVEADCGGYAKFASIKLALGIKRAVQPPPRSFTRCPLKRARRP
jgi:hypothetical protein